MEHAAFPKKNNHTEQVYHEFGEMVDHEYVQQKSQQAGEWHCSLRRCQIINVPPELRLRSGQRRKNIYGPITVSVGPYHHGKPELRRAEGFKHHCLNWCTRNTTKPLKATLFDIILEKIDAIRECYPEATIVEKYDDITLAKMVLLDACFIVNFMESITNFTETSNMNEWRHGLGAAAIYAFVFRDLMLLENQIPFAVITMLIKLKNSDDEGHDGEELIERFLRMCMIIENGQVYRKKKVPPMHLLEACRRVMVEKHNAKPKQVQNQTPAKFHWPKLLTRRKKDEISEMRALPLTPAAIQMLCICRAAMDLKAKGIHLSPSSYSLSDITFHSSTFSGHLRLPTRSVSEQTLVILSNMIAYEVSPNARKMRPSVLSYAIFMKSLIQSTADVKEMQEKGILINRLANFDQVVRVFDQIDTFGITHMDAFIDVRWQIEKHCSNRAKTWIADLIHSRFSSPWTAIAMFAGAFLLCLTFLQAYFAIRPVK